VQLLFFYNDDRTTSSHFVGQRIIIRFLHAESVRDSLKFLLDFRNKLRKKLCQRRKCSTSVKILGKASPTQNAYEFRLVRSMTTAMIIIQKRRKNLNLLHNALKNEAICSGIFPNVFIPTGCLLPFLYLTKIVRVRIVLSIKASRSYKKFS
jgi:hypothetical protein